MARRGQGLHLPLTVNLTRETLNFPYRRTDSITAPGIAHGLRRGVGASNPAALVEKASQMLHPGQQGMQGVVAKTH